MSGTLDRLPPLARYSLTAERASGQIIEAYSTSFGTATRLLGRRHRAHVRNIYALVRVADELVDGVATEAGLSPEQQHRALAQLREETESAIKLGYSSNPIVHAFAHTARQSGIDTSLTAPFFDSMRADLPQTGPETGPLAGSGLTYFDPDAHRDYVHGSAEVVGLMCLRVFTRYEVLTPSRRNTLEHGARSLGAAFQNVNFLRDLADDTSRLRRSYLSVDGELDDADRDRWVATIREQLADASAVLPLLPGDAALAVRCALNLFAALTERIAAAPLPELRSRRIRLSTAAKTRILLQSLAASRKQAG